MITTDPPPAMVAMTPATTIARILTRANTPCWTEIASTAVRMVATAPPFGWIDRARCWCNRRWCSWQHDHTKRVRSSGNHLGCRGREHQPVRRSIATTFGADSTGFGVDRRPRLFRSNR